MGSKPTVGGGGGGGSARGSWDPEVSLGPAPILEEVAQSFLFVVQQHLVFLLGVTINTRNNKIRRVSNGVSI